MNGADGRDEQNWCAGRLITSLPPVSPDAPCKAAFDMMMLHTTAPCLAVVENNKPVAQLTRQEILVAFSQPLARAAYERRSVARLLLSPFITARPLIVEADVGIERLKELITTSHPRAVVDGFIITQNGDYAGIGSGINLLGLTLERARGQIDALNESRLAAQQASRAKTTFLASISHELRTPLNAVIGFSEVLQQQYFGPLNSKQSEYVVDILHSGQHLLELINDILDLSKAEAGKLDLVEEEVDLNALVIQALRMLQPRIEAKGIVTSTDLPYRTLRIEGDRQKLKQVLINLLTNAVKFTPAGGSIRIRALVESDGAPSLIVEDTGIGIEPEAIEKMLLPFERAQSRATLAQEGTGIGLPLSKMIVERHGGTLRLVSEVGRGTTVIVKLPPSRLRFHVADRMDDAAVSLAGAPNQVSATG